VTARRFRGRHEPLTITIRTPGARVTLSKADAETIARALADAEGYRRLRADQWCMNCETAPQGACQDHVADLDLADAYRDLGVVFADVLPEPPGEGGRP
jgi:hypothetical protein